MLTMHAYGISAQLWSAMIQSINGKYLILTQEHEPLIAQSKTHKFNVSNVPLLPKIPLINVVVDNLHMFLRVADLLIDMVIGELCALDKVNQSLRVRSLEGLTHLASNEAALKSIGISFLGW